MLQPIHYRIFGQVATLCAHSINTLVMLNALQDEIIMKDPEIRKLASMQSSFLTIWNIAFQLAYSSLALTCDGLALINKDDILPKSIKKFRHTLFTGIVFPGTMVIFIVFWPTYLYDRNIIFPEFIDKVFSQKSNYVMHIAIVPSVLWELVFQPRTVPKSHKVYLQIVTGYFSVYSLFIFYTYALRGLWPYPLLGMVQGTIYFPMIFSFVYVITLFSYYLQWFLTSLIWTQEKKPMKKIN